MTSQTASRALALWYHLGHFVCMHLTPFQTHTSHAHLLFHPLPLFALSWINCYFSPPFLSGQFLCSFMLSLPSPLLTPSLPQMLNHPNYALFVSYPCASLFILPSTLLPFLLFILLFLSTNFLLPAALVCGWITAPSMRFYIFHIPPFSHIHLS